MPLSNRTVSALSQHAKNTGLLPTLPRVLDTLGRLLLLLGKQSQGRAMMFKIGQQLFQENVRIVAPSCPDYSHQGGIYTFASLGSGIPLLATLHLEPLQPIKKVLPGAQVEIVLADLEAQDTILQAKLGVNQTRFRECVEASAAALRHALAKDDILVALMSTRFPTLQAEEVRMRLTIENDRSRGARIINDTHARRPLYEKLGVTSTEAMYARTLKTAVEYATLGAIARREQFLVCNHHTVNLAWYTDSGAAVLHNAVNIY